MRHRSRKANLPPLWLHLSFLLHYTSAFKINNFTEKQNILILKQNITLLQLDKLVPGGNINLFKAFRSNIFAAEDFKW